MDVGRYSQNGNVVVFREQIRYTYVQRMYLLLYILYKVIVDIEHVFTGVDSCCKVCTVVCIAQQKENFLIKSVLTHS